MGIGAKGDEVLNALGKRYEGFTPAELAKYGDYCVNDVELTHTLLHKYMGMGFPQKELQLIDLTLRMFIEPSFRLDSGLLETHLAEVKAKKQNLLEEVFDLLVASETDLDTRAELAASGLEGIKTLLMSNPKFAEALRAVGVEPPRKVSATTGKEAWAFAKTDEAFKALEEHPDERVQALVAARLGNKTTIEESRTETLIEYATRGLFPIALRYYGAATGRWSAESSAKVNMQNLPRSSPIKNAIKAPAGYVVCGADLSNIELRLGLWLAEQDDRVQMLADGLDLYKDFAAVVFGVEYDAVTKPQRQVGKVSNLSLIYGTGPAKLREALRIMGGITMGLEQVKPIVQLYRSRNSRVVAGWRAGEGALQAMVNDQHMELYRGTCLVEGRRGIRLPSGLHLQYPNLRRVTNEETGKAEWVFDSKYGLERIYGSKVFQGCTQAIARCIMGEGLLKLNKFTPVALTIHDSAYWLAPEAEAEASLQRGIEAITKPVKYCPGLPLAAEGAFGPTLADC
jgi:DNA polymerase